MANSTRIASVHFMAVTAHRNYRSAAYIIPVAEEIGNPNIIEVTQLIQREQGPYGANKFREVRTNLITSDEIANDLVKEWTQSGIYMDDEARPGVWIVRDRLPVMDDVVDGNGVKVGGRIRVEPNMLGQMTAVFRDATEVERASMWLEDFHMNTQLDARYGDRLISKGLEIHSDPKKFAGTPISIPMKEAARFYKVDAPYLHQLTSVNTKTCPWCLSMVDGRAIICPVCTKTIDVLAKEQLEIRQRSDASAARNAIKEQEKAS